MSVTVSRVTIWRHRGKVAPIRCDTCSCCFFCKIDGTNCGPWCHCHPEHKEYAALRYLTSADPIVRWIPPVPRLRSSKARKAEEAFRSRLRRDAERRARRELEMQDPRAFDESIARAIEKMEAREERLRRKQVEG